MFEEVLKYTTEWYKPTSNSLDKDISVFTEGLVQACDLAMPKKRKVDRAAVFWWTPEISVMRNNACVHAGSMLGDMMRCQ